MLLSDLKDITFLPAAPYTVAGHVVFFYFDYYFFFLPETECICVLFNSNGISVWRYARVEFSFVWYFCRHWHLETGVCAIVRVNTK